VTQRVALVTGARTGIGRAIAERLLRDGYALGFVTHTEDEAAADELRRLGTLHHVWGDLADPNEPKRIVAEVADHFGRLDVLVNNAGLSTAKPALELTADDFDRTFDVDVRAALLASQEAARRMTDGGVIVNITSVHEHVPRPGFAVYASAKAALGMLTRGLALELAPRIRVVSVAPGAIATERNVEAGDLAAEIPLGRPGTAEEVAALVAWVASPEASYVSGTSIVVDGALTHQVVDAPAGR
jgi:NAD(P)-dependent dehydrogenase (short-subunit alcohol dehydrogenase family)